MKTVTEIWAAIKTLSPEEREEVKLFLRELGKKDFQKVLDDEATPQAPSGAKSL